MAFGLWMLAHLEATTPLPVLWGWMFVTGIGVGPTFAVFTLIVQNGVPVARLGTATSNLTFFQQVGGTVGLAITGTIFGSRLIEELPGTAGRSRRSARDRRGARRRWPRESRCFDRCR